MWIIERISGRAAARITGFSAKWNALMSIERPRATRGWGGEPCWQVL
jgi:hypothetical protein